MFTPDYSKAPACNAPERVRRVTVDTHRVEMKSRCVYCKQYIVLEEHVNILRTTKWSTTVSSLQPVFPDWNRPVCL